MDRPALPTLRQLAYLVELSERLNFGSMPKCGSAPGDWQGVGGESPLR
jgi:hypothetical protein